jgi:hypothetical protein
MIDKKTLYFDIIFRSSALLYREPSAPRRIDRTGLLQSDPPNAGLHHDFQPNRSSAQLRAPACGN